MLSYAEADLARRDLGIPGLATVLDPDAFLAALRRAAPKVSRAEIGHVKYSPGAFCRAAYRIEVGSAEFDIDVRACRPQELLSWVRKAHPADSPGPLETPCMVLRDLAVVVTVFPNDPKLPQLGSLTDSDRRTRVLRDLLPDQPELWEAEIRCLRYRPERRYAAELRGRDGRRALLKALTRKGYLRAKRGATAFRSSPPLRVARLLGASDQRHLLCLEWMPGTMLSDRSVLPEADCRAFSDTGVALAALHAQSADGLERWTRDDEIDYLYTLSREIAFIYPGFSAQARTLVRRLASWLRELPPVSLPLHGDFNGGQVLIDGHDVAIVDLDSAYCGDPADDLGNLLAQLETFALHGKLSADRVAQSRDALLSGYRHMGRVALLERVGPYTASGLLRRARYAFRDRTIDWRQVVAASLERAEAILDDGRSTRARGAQPSGVRPVEGPDRPRPTARGNPRGPAPTGVRVPGPRPR